MKTLRRLMLSPQELERLCGFEVGELWVGSLWGGAYRSGAWQPEQWPKMLALEGLVLGMMFVLAVPVGLMALRFTGQAGQGSGSALVFGVGVVIATVFLSVLRRGAMARKRRQLRSLLPILDEVDRFHDTLQAFELLQELASLAPPQGRTPRDVVQERALSADRLDLEALEEAFVLTRDSLVTGLMAESLLRQHQPFLSRSDELLAHLEQNLITLHSLDLGHQAAEQAVLLRETLQISSSVRQTLQSQLP